MNVSGKQWGVGVIVIFCVAIGAWYYAGKPAASPYIATDNAVVRVAATGGLCLYGGCASELIIYRDGKYIYSDGTEVNQEGVFAKEDVDMLVGLIAQADFAAIKAKKFTGTCPVAYDGQEFTYTFYVVDETIKSCTVDIDEQSPLFTLIEELYSRVFAGL